MRLERGFRRIVVVLSAGTFLLGIAVVVSLAPPPLEVERVGETATQMFERMDGGAKPWTCLFRVRADRGTYRVEAPETATHADLARLIGEGKGQLLDAPFLGSRRATQMAVAILIVVGVSLIPWAFFYTMRWIVRGFTSPG